MAYQYSNPFQAPSAPSRSTFNAVGSTMSGSQVLFGGLPLDVVENDIKELLLTQPLALAAATTSARAIYDASGSFTGFAIVTVGNEADAERIRREYSGQTIDGTYRLTVQHILPPTQPLPNQSVVPMVVPQASASVQPKPTPPARNTVRPGPKTVAPPAKANKAPGLQLLARMSKSGPPGVREKQMALLAQQKANLKGSGHPGAALLSRIARPPIKPNSTAKVTRAKQSMDIDKPVKAQPVKAKPKPKTQAELDEEMRLYTRQSRFA